MVAYYKKIIYKQMGLNAQSGFTIIELLVVITVISIITGFVFAYLPESQTRARDGERQADIETIGRYFEQKYTTEASATYPTYPSTSNLASTISALSNKGFEEAAISPKNSSSSIVAASGIGDITGSIDADTYTYQPFSSDGSLCTSSSAAQPCVRFTLWYKIELDGTVKKLESRHQQ